MRRNAALCAITGLALMAPIGCQDLPGGPKEQGAVIGGVGGAVAGAAVSGSNPLLGALIGGALGAGGGYLIGAEVGYIDDDDSESAVEAAKEGQRNPATPEEARAAATADVNGDGFVTMDEVIAMEQAGFDDQEMLRRLRSTNQIFELTQEQEEYLVQRGISRNVVTDMREINQAERQRLLSERRDVISQPR